MPNLSVTYDDMRNAATRLTNGENELQAKLHDLKSLIDSLVTGGYVTDKSSKAFEQAYTEFNTGATQTIEGLNGMAQYLNNAAETMDQTDTNLASAVKG